MTIISKYARAQMVRAVLKHKYDAEAKAVMAQDQALLVRLYHFLVPPKVQEAMDKVVELEKGAFHELHSMWVRANGGMTQLSLRPYISFKGTEYVPRGEYTGRPLWMPFDIAPNSTGTVNINNYDTKLAEDVLEYMQERRMFVNTVEVAAREISSAFDAMNTVKKLRTQWPEVLPLVEELLPTPANRNLPTVQVADINAKFKLPPNQTEGE
jgi:hypothetical protein